MHWPREDGISKLAGRPRIDEELTVGLLDYLLSWGQFTLSSILSTKSSYHSYMGDHDHLGWTNFVEGCIYKSLISLQQGFLYCTDSTLHVHTWKANLVQNLLSITHHQWTYRNAKIHLNKLKGRTAAEHESILNKVRDMTTVEPDKLQSCQHSLLQAEFHQQGEGSTGYHPHWLEEINSAISAWHALIPHRDTIHNTLTHWVGLATTKQSNLSKMDNKPIW